jgi:uncharacterized protein
MIDKIKKLCEEKYPERHYYYHILSVVDNALVLGKKLNADLEVVELAAYLHDIAWGFEEIVRDNNHHETGAEKAEEILNKFNYPKETIDKVKHCVVAHRGRSDSKPETLEAEIVANADAMAHFDAFPDLLLFFNEGNSFEDSISELSGKIERDWALKLTLPEAKELSKEKYTAIKLLLNEMQKYIDKRHK